MLQNGLRVIARIRAKHDKVNEVGRLLFGLIEPTRREEGCVTYELLQNREDPTDFTFVEEWTSAEALDRHFATEHFKNVQPQLAELAAEEPDIRTYRLLNRRNSNS